MHPIIISLTFRLAILDSKFILLLEIDGLVA